MAEAVVGVVIEQLVSATTEWLTEEISMIKGVENELENMSKKMQLLQKVLDDAENRSVRESIVQEWLDKLQDLSYEMEDVLDEWNTIVNKLKLKEAENNSSSTQISSSVASSSIFTCLPSNCFNSVKQLGWRRDLASKIKIINQNVDSLFNQMDQFEFISSKIRSVGPDALTMNNCEIDRMTTSLVNKSLIHGRDDEKEELLSMLLCENSEGGDDISVVSIVGLGGLGKTTIAQLVYNDESVIKDFEKKIWVCVSNTFDEVKVARGILEGLEVSHIGKDELQTLHQSVQSSLADHKFLLVLDDVWNEELGKWGRLRACLETGAQGSRVLITTRIDKVARIMNTNEANMLRPRLMSESDCWLLMSHVAFHGKGKDNVHYEIEVKELITLWIANGYINPTQEIYDLERVGQEYCTYLLSRSFFQVRDKSYSSTTYVSVHDIMHDFALHLSKDNFLTCTKDDSNSEPNSLKLHKSKKSRHLFISGEIPFPACDVGRLRTCLAKSVPRDVTLDMLRHLKVVRTLSLIECDLEEIPQGIGKLIHLRTLDLSYNDSLKELPETTLISKSFLSRLEKLINLRILVVKRNKWKLLDVESLDKLVNLQNLSEVHVEAGSRGLGFLKNLNQLDKDLEIVFESDYSDGGDANEAKLKSKKHIKKLTFNFKGKDVAEVVVDALEPPTEVKVLHILNFRGTKLPSWITSLNNITELKVSSAKYIVSLPPLGKLPYLENLKIHRLSALKFIGRDFLGIDNSDKSNTIGNEPPSSSSSIIAFPALDELELLSLDELEKWEDLKVEEEDMTNVMPKLKSLTIQRCPKLEVMPLRILRKASPFLKRLVLDKIELPSNLTFTSEEVVEGTVKTVLQPFPNLETLNIQNCMGPRLPSWISCLNCLTGLHLIGAEEVQSLPPLGKLPLLELLIITDFSSLKSIGREFLGIDIEMKVNTSIAAAAPDSSSSSTKIEGMEEDNKQKNIISTSITYFPKLKRLYISSCSELEVWEDIKAEEDAITVMPNLNYLFITNCPKLEVLPYGLPWSASSLRQLEISGCKSGSRWCIDDIQNQSITDGPLSFPVLTPSLSGCTFTPEELVWLRHHYQEFLKREREREDNPDKE